MTRTHSWVSCFGAIAILTQLCLCSLTGHADGIGASPSRDDKHLALQESQSATLDLEGTSARAFLTSARAFCKKTSNIFGPASKGTHSKSQGCYNKNQDVTTKTSKGASAQIVIVAAARACKTCLATPADPTNGQTMFDCTSCEKGHELVATNLMKRAGWCNSNTACPSKWSGRKAANRLKYARCKSCVLGNQQPYVSCTSCPKHATFQPYTAGANLADFTHKSLQHAWGKPGPYSIKYGLGSCIRNIRDQKMSFKNKKGTGIYAGCVNQQPYGVLRRW